MKIKLSNILGIASFVGSLVKAVQAKIGGKPGREKAAIVVEQLTALLPVIEGITKRDIVDEAAWLYAVNQVIAAEKAVMNAVEAADAARNALAALVADIKAKAKS